MKAKQFPGLILSPKKKKKEKKVASFASVVQHHGQGQFHISSLGIRRKLLKNRHAQERSLRLLEDRADCPDDRPVYCAMK